MLPVARLPVDEIAPEDTPSTSNTPTIVFPEGNVGGNGPSGPVLPVLPVLPVGPCGPWDPWAPWAPVEPVAPFFPLNNATVLGATLLGVTDPFLSCFAPTLLAGRLLAAYAPPPRAMKTATVAMTFA